MAQVAGAAASKRAFAAACRAAPIPPRAWAPVLEVPRPIGIAFDASDCCNQAGRRLHCLAQSNPSFSTPFCATRHGERRRFVPPQLHPRMMRMPPRLRQLCSVLQRPCKRIRKRARRDIIIPGPTLRLGSQFPEIEIRDTAFLSFGFLRRVLASLRRSPADLISVTGINASSSQPGNDRRHAKYHKRTMAQYGRHPSEPLPRDRHLDICLTATEHRC